MGKGPQPGRGVLPYITYKLWVCAAQRGCDFEAPEWGTHFRGVF